MKSSRVATQRHTRARRIGAAASSIVIAAASVPAVAEPAPQAHTTEQLCASESPQVGGTLGKFRSLSTPFAEPASRLPAGAPNVLVWLMDDVGFGQLSPFGGLIPMPSLDQLAQPSVAGRGSADVVTYGLWLR